MPNVLDANGLQLETYDELLAYFTGKYQTIYGADVNLDSNTPDGQWMRLIIQTIMDRNDLLAQVFSTMDPDNAIGRVLDQRCAINGVERKGGTFTITPVTLVTDRALDLPGLDQTEDPVYSVGDNAGNVWQLITSQPGVPAGTHVFQFQAAKPGAQLTIINTITVPVTVVLGVSLINNPTPYAQLGTNEESDPVMKTRRQKSVSLPAQGYAAALEAALANINGVTYARVFENRTDFTDADGTPPHCIWVIVAGTAAAADIANAIYVKRGAGADMRGETTYNVTQTHPDGTTSEFEVQWDEVIEQPLFIRFTASSIDGTTAPNVTAIRTQLPQVLTPGVNEDVNINQVATKAQQIDGNTLVTGAGVSTGETQTLNLSGVPASGAFVVKYAGNLTASIAWNDSTATIQTKLRAVAGLGACVVTGTLAGQSLAVALFGSGIGIVQGLLTVPTNTLQTSGPVAITFSFDEGYQNTLTPDSKRHQFQATSPNIIIAPILLPSTSSVATSGLVAFSGLGGYGTLTYAFVNNVSGGTIDPGTGAYVAGVSTGVDTLKVTDELGAIGTATVTVS